MNLATEIEILYDMIARDETEDALIRLLMISKQFDLPFRNEVILLSNKFHTKRKNNNSADDDLEEDLVHEYNMSMLGFLDQIKFEESLGMKSLKHLIEDLTESRRMSVDLEQQLWKARKKIKRLRKKLPHQEEE